MTTYDDDPVWQHPRVVELLENLTSVQNRCSDLLENRRELLRICRVALDILELSDFSAIARDARASIEAKDRLKMAIGDACERMR